MLRQQLNPQTRRFSYWRDVAPTAPSSIHTMCKIIFYSLFDHLSEDQQVNQFIYQNEERLREDFLKKFITLEKTLEVISARLREAKKQNLYNVELIWNAAGYINTCSFDLAVAGEALMFERDAWKRRYYSRMAAVNIYEASLDIPKIVGKEFRYEVCKLPRGSEFIEELGSTLKKFNKFRINNSAWLKDVRVCCAAHRDKDISEQLRVIFEISPTKVLKIMAEFDALLNELGSIFQKGMNLLPEKNYV